MTSHPRRSMKVETLHDTLSTPSQFSRKWTWYEVVSLPDGRKFRVLQGSMMGAFEGSTSRALVEAFLDGTLQTQTVVEI